MSKPGLPEQARERNYPRKLTFCRKCPKSFVVTTSCTYSMCRCHRNKMPLSLTPWIPQIFEKALSVISSLISFFQTPSNTLTPPVKLPLRTACRIVTFRRETDCFVNKRFRTPCNSGTFGFLTSHFIHIVPQQVGDGAWLSWDLPPGWEEVGPGSPESWACHPRGTELRQEVGSVVSVCA